MDAKSWLGTSIEDLNEYNGPFSFTVPNVSPSSYHTILYELPVTVSSNNPPKPHRNIEDKHWDADHVKMPYSPKNLYPVKNDNGEETLLSRWAIIREAFSKPIKSSYDFEAAVNTYNQAPKFEALHYFFEEVTDRDARDSIFETVIPGIVELALKLPDILPGNVPLLKKEMNHSLSLSQLQIACLLANGFLCTFPWRKDASNTYPGLNFARLFSANRRPKRQECIMEKFKCIFHYFQRVLTKAPCGVVTFQRKHMSRNQVPRWDRVNNNLGNTKVHVSSEGTIEDNGIGYLQVDFANKFVGGGVLAYGCVQEEIRYIICPELIVSRLFTEELGPTEALVIYGVERYSNYTGYGDTFTWNGNFEDKTPFDTFGRRKTSVVAIDAIKFNRPGDQFGSSVVLRELNKAYAGFHSHFEGRLSPVATGNWGCGAFKGDPKLKFLIQLMACNAAGRNMVYYTFDNADLRDTIHNLYLFLGNNKITTVELWRLLCKFAAAKLKNDSFIPFLQQAYFDKQTQLNIKQFYAPASKKPETDKNTENQPSSSSDSISRMSLGSPENNSETIDDSDIDIVESSQDFSEKKSVPLKKLSRPEKKQRNEASSVLDLIDAIDGRKTESRKEESLPSLLSAIDDICQNSKVVVANDRSVSEDVCIQMEVDEVVDSVGKITAPKRKISDYFVKINK